MDIIGAMSFTWNDFFSTLGTKSYWSRLQAKVFDAYSKGVCYPPQEKMYAAFDACPVDKVKVVVLGQDPYPNPGQAMGLSFSVPTGVPLPPSLRNIYQEIENEGFGFMDKNNGDLTYLAEQGVLLLNSYLSVMAGAPASHAWPEYEEFAHDVLRFLSSLSQPIVFMFWGSFAKKYAPFATNPEHLKLFANHPSPLSANRGGWFGCGHFKAANDYLIAHGSAPIDWCNSLLKL